MTKIRRPAILIVDADVAGIQKTAACLLTGQFAVYQATDRAMAVQMASSHSLQLIVCDVNTANFGCTARNLINALRRLQGRNNVSVMFTSMAQLSNVAHRNHAWGMSFHVRKPFDQGVFISLVAKSLKSLTNAQQPESVATIACPHLPSVQIPLGPSTFAQ